MPSLRLSIAFILTACSYAAVTSAQPPPPARPAQQAPAGPPSTPPWQAATPWPDRIVVTVAEDPKTSFSVSWRTAANVAGARAELVVAGDEARFDLAATAVDATTVRPDLQTKTVGEQSYALRWNAEIDAPAYHSVTFTGLTPDTLYAYRVQGAEGHWSEWLQTRTAPAAAEPFRFLYFGDAQDGISSHWPRVVRAAFATAPDARFAIHAGDLVNWGSRDFEWAAWFKSVGFIHGMIPAVPVVGNHEYFDGIVGPGGTQVTALSVLWRPQFALPEVAALPEALKETVYSFEYADTIVVVLDTMAAEHFAAQAAWLDATLAASDATWKIVTMHHPMFELLERTGFAAAGETGPERREIFLPVLARHGVDLVLQGHDHSYGRGATLTRRTPNAARAGTLGTVFVTSSAGAKMYSVSDLGWSAFAEQGAVLERTAENTPFFQVIAVDGDVLRYEARTATGRLYDAFRLLKPRTGPNRLEALPTDFDTTRTFENTGGDIDGRYDVVPTRPAP
jgi:3',5'-cyclic AMP phosphodiesterase CpdA